MFKSSKRVHLSPRLARTIGTTDRDTKVYRTKVVSIFGLAFLFFLVFSGFGNKIVTKSQISAHNDTGEVLGAKDNNVVYYQVKPGDTLIGVSQEFQVYWMTIVEENELAVPYILTQGQVLRIPLPRIK